MYDIYILQMEIENCNAHTLPRCGLPVQHNGSAAFCGSGIRVEKSQCRHSSRFLFVRIRDSHPHSALSGLIKKHEYPAHKVIPPTYIHETRWDT